MFYNFAAEVDAYAGAHPRKRAIVCVSQDGIVSDLTYGQMRVRSNRLADGLVKKGIRRGDRVVVLLPRGMDAYIVYLALLKAGAVIMPGSEMLRAKDIEYRCRHAQPKAVIAAGGIAPEVDLVRETCNSLEIFATAGDSLPGWIPLQELENSGSEDFVAVETEEDEMAFLSYTSGTTGGPKGVVHRHAWPKYHLAIAATHWFDVREDDLAWATAGPGWAKWVWSPFVSVLGKGATALVYEGRFQPETYLRLMEAQGVTLLCATPTEYRMMAKVNDLERFRLPVLRSAVSAGEPLNREVIDTFQRHFGVLVRDGYGQTENTLLVGTFVGLPARPGSMGKPFPGTTVAIVDEEGQILPPGQVGDIAVHKDHPALFRGYLHDEERTAKAFRGDWYITGDQGRQDAEGYFWFEGRADDIIISGGYTIGPFEVEDALVKHPKVAECAAVAAPDEERGHIVKAFVVLRDPADASPELVQTLQEHVKKITAPYKYPREIEFVESLPKTPSGKIRRVELRALEKSRRTGGS